MLRRIKNNFVWLVLAVLVIGAVFIWLTVSGQGFNNKVRIDFLDVGQGSAILIDAPNGNQVLIDGGPSDAVLARLGRALPLFDKKIELLILTHPDSDHLSGLVEVLRRYEVGQILETGITSDSAEYKEWSNLIKNKNIPVVFAVAGQKIKVADNLLIEILYPFGRLNGQNFGSETNKTSIVGKIIYGQNSILFTGDADEAVEQPLLLFNANLRADILAVAHHGSKTSTSAEFLAAVLPRLAIISVGAKNRYGHPAPELLARLKDFEIFRTDQSGTIDFSCDLSKCYREDD